MTAAVGGTNLTATFQVEVRFPAITMLISPKGAAYGESDTIQPLTVKAAAGAHTVRYRWYKLGENGEKTEISGADGASYLPTEAGSYAAAAYLVDSKGQTSNEVLSATAKIEVGSFVAIVNGSGYSSLAEAIENAPDGSTVQLCKDVTVAQAISISGKKLTLDGSGHRMDRGNGYSNEFIALRNSADLTVKNITLDGGAQWTGDVDDILQRGTTNSGMKAGRPLILTRTQAQLTLGSGAVLQNNDNQANAYSGKVDGTAPFGGAAQIGDGILALNGGEIRNCNSAVFGGAAHIRGSSTFTAKAGTVSGNNAGGVAAICLDNTARSIVEGGEFSNNKSGNNGGVFWLNMGTLSITGGVFENNSTAGKGGVAYQDKASASVSLKGGVFRNNRAKGDGGVLYTPNGLSISGGSYEGNTSDGNGGAVWTNGTLSISGGSFRDNTAQKGAAIYQEGGKDVTITGFEEMQEIYLKTLGKITIQNELKGKRLPLQTESAVTNGMTVATLMVARPQEYGAVTTLNGNTVLAVQDGTAGWFLKVDQAAQVCTVTYHTDGGSIQNQSNYGSYRVGVGLTLPIPTKEGFLFQGWYPTEDFSGEAVTVIGTDAAGDKTYYAKWEKDEPLVDAAKPAAITLADASYEVGKTAEPLNGKTTVTDNGTITYQWYRTNAVDDFNGTLLDGEIGETFTPPTDAVGTQYYYVIATNTKTDATGEQTAETRSNTVTITVTEKAVTYTVSYDWGTEFPEGVTLPTDTGAYHRVQDAEAAMDKTYTASSTANAQKDGKDGTWIFSGWTATVENTVVKFTGKWTFTETIKVDAAKPAEITLADASYTVGDSAAALNGETTVTDNGKITYQWYEATSKDDQDGMLLEGKTDPTFTPDTAAAGTRFYYVVATNTNANATGEQTAETRSNTVAITVTEKAVTYTVSYDWGTEVPDGETLPTDTGAYQSVQDAEAAMDKTYTASSTSTAQKDGKDGTWTFSGWTASVEGTVVKFTGEWTFTETLKVDAAKPAAITLADASYTVGDNATALNGTTTAADGGEITYQWYEASSKDDQNGTLLEGKTTPTFTPDTAAAGTHFYYVVATNTNANATGKQTAETRSNTVQITVQEPAPVEMFTVRYEWDGEAPSDAKLPQDDHTYDTEEQARAAMDTTYTANSTSTARKDGKDGTWTFSGWTATAEGTVVKFSGKWTFTETPVRPGRPSFDGLSDRDQNHSVSAPSHINGGAVSVTPAAAPKGTTVTITAKPDNGYKLDKLIVTDQSGNRLSLNDQGNGKYTFTMPSGKVNVDAAFSKIATTISFRDVKQSDYYYDAVRWAVEKGITEGTSIDTFSPHASCTRAQTVTFLWRAAGSPEPTDTVNPFSDLSPNAYYYKAVLWAVENGITQGTSTDTFSPDATVTRGQTVTFLHRAAGSPAAGNDSFNDVSANAYYAKAVAWANENGITSGTGNGKFSPNADCTRGQIVTLLYRTDN